MRNCLAGLTLVLLLPACTTLSENKRQVALDETLLLYEKAVRWGDYAIIRHIQKLPDGTQATAEPRIRVTSYRQSTPRPLDDGNRVSVSARIDYYDNDTLKLKSVTDEQQWQYSPGENAWHITTPLPDFSAQDQR